MSTHRPFAELVANSERWRQEHPWRQQAWAWRCWVWNTFLSWSEWRYRLRRFRWLFVRGWRGWAPNDVWSIDWYLSGVLAGMLTHLADHHHGVPNAFLPAPLDATHEDLEAADVIWTAWLRDKAAWFAWYHADCFEYDDVHRAKIARFHSEVLPDFVQHWGALWD